MRSRLTPIDASFLRLETANAHMHVAWCGMFEAHPSRPRPTLDGVRASVAGRLQHAARFRQRVAFPPGGLGDPYWVDDEAFDIRDHVTAMCEPDETISRRRFMTLCDVALSEPLDRRRALWQIQLAPQLEDGRVGLLTKMHHAMVDGKSAVELALLLFDLAEDALPEPADDWSPARTPSGPSLAGKALVDNASDSLRTARRAVQMATSGGAGLTGTLRRTAMAVGEDLLRPAPSSYLNSSIGPRRTLVRHRAPVDPILSAKRAAGVTFNDACLAAVAGALRELALTRRRNPQPLKAMVPVSVRADDERTSLGNRISFAFIDLPVDVHAPRERLARIHSQTQAFKRSGRPAGTEAVLGAVGRLPAPLKTRAARLAASARVYNLTVSNVPGPREPVYMLGARLEEAYPVVPIAEDHSLSIGMFSYREHVFFGAYADPTALPEAEALGSALNTAVLALPRRAARRRGQVRGRGPRREKAVSAAG